MRWLAARHPSLSVLLAFLCAGACTARADSRAFDASKLPPAAARRIDFVNDVRPLFAAHCYRCHGPEKQRNALRLDSKQVALAGGSSGKVIVPGDSAASLLIRYVSGSDPKTVMPPEGPRLSAEQVGVLRAWIDQGAEWPDAASVKVADKFDQWALKPVVRPGVPAFAGADAAWVRNAVDAFVLAKLKEKGLAPSAEADRRTLIRRIYFDLVGLPPTPEDVDRFAADLDPRAYEKLVDKLLASPAYGERWARHWLDVVHYGDTHGYDKDKVRPNAWPYRDYVIRALNDDKPYDRFVKEQLAGDHFYPGTPDGVAALGFLAAGPWDYVGQVEVKDGTLEKARVRNIDRDDMVSVTMNTFVSLTAQCARCHDHKFDPVSQEDYYSLQAVFAALDRADRRVGPLVVYAAVTAFDGADQFQPTGGKPRPIHVLARGNENAPGRPAGPGTVGAIRELPARFNLPEGHDESRRRAALAEWIVSERNPLTWRSIVNRVWHYHFGRGIVETPNDFGRMGAAPTHPELLDWLAAEFRNGGEFVNARSLKQLHRLIVTSSTYRQSSANNASFAKLDGGNQFLWRQKRRRLDAEALRDTVLSVSGLLDTGRTGGPPFKVFGFEDDHSPRYDYAAFDPDDPASHRRSIYRLIVRSVPDPFMETLDCADPSQVVERRNETLTALQALSLMNNKFMVRMAERFAGRVAKDSADVGEQIDTGFRLTLGRSPTAEEARVLGDIAREHGMANACRIIFNMNEFVFTD